MSNTSVNPLAAFKAAGAAKEDEPKAVSHVD